MEVPYPAPAPALTPAYVPTYAYAVAKVYKSAPQLVAVFPPARPDAPTYVRRLHIEGPQGSRCTVFFGDPPDDSQQGSMSIPNRRLDGTHRGDLDTATWDPTPLYVRAGASLIVVWDTLLGAADAHLETLP